MRALVAGFGNVFFGDDGYGCAVVRALLEEPLPPDVRVRDFGISGMHLALEMLEPYELVILVDALRRDDPPGTVYVLEPDAVEGPAAADAHAMDVRSVLALSASLRETLEASVPPKILIVGCVPETVAEGMTLSEPVRAALPVSAARIRSLLQGVLV